MKKLLVFVCVMAFTAVTSAFAGVINVDINEVACVSTSGQPDPYTIVYCNVQDAINDANALDVVLVADGTYTGDGNKNLDFGGKAITVRSENGPQNCIIDCEGDGRGFNFQSREDLSSVVSGFTITNGVELDGGGIRCYGSSPTITNCIITGNSTRSTYGDYYGGGIYCRSANIMNPVHPVITNSIIAGNQAGRRGGGIFLWDALATITNCTITGNSTSNDFDASGGGICVYGVVESIITNCIIWGNYPNGGIGINDSVTYSNIEGGREGEGNINIPPAFVDRSNGNYHLLNYSPCIGAGSSDGAPDNDIEENPRPNPPGSNPDMGAYENALSSPDLLPLDIFAMAIGNQWIYDSNFRRRINKLNQTTFPKDTYEMEIFENDLLSGKEWYESTEKELLFWGIENDDIAFNFSKGLTVAWDPLLVGERRRSSAGVIGFPGVLVGMTVDVLDYEPLSLSFGTVDAYKLHYKFIIWSPIGIYGVNYDWWVVPYLGVVKQQTAGGEEQLLSFFIGGGAISEGPDYDNDGLMDYEEIIIYNTDYQDADTDDDGIGDFSDICPNDYNPDQNDSDQDGFGDACDICPSDPDNDIDEDGICGDADPCPDSPENNCNPPTSVSLTSDLSSPQVEGTEVTFTALTTGDFGNYEYKFLVRRIFGRLILPIDEQSYSSSNTFQYIGSSGIYAISVLARNAGSTQRYQVWKNMWFRFE